MLGMVNMLIVIPHLKKAANEITECLKIERQIKKQQEDNEKRYKYEIKRFLENR